MGKCEKRFSALRAELARIDCSQEEFAFEIKRSLPYISLRMNGHKPWDMDDVYRALKFLQLPPEQMAFYFPKGGVSRMPSVINGEPPRLASRTAQ